MGPYKQIRIYASFNIWLMGLWGISPWLESISVWQVQTHTTSNLGCMIFESKSTIDQSFLNREIEVTLLLPFNLGTAQKLTSWGPGGNNCVLKDLSVRWELLGDMLNTEKQTIKWYLAYITHTLHITYMYTYNSHVIHIHIYMSFASDRWGVKLFCPLF